MTTDKMLGAWMGAAIGDAMGGPVECQHYRRIMRKVGTINRLLPYNGQWAIMEPHPGYAIHGEAGSVTDDTYIRADIARYLLNTEKPWTAERLCSYLIENADFSCWWPPAVEALRRVERGASAAESGSIHPQGGGNGWWYPVAMLLGGRPSKAAEVVRTLSSPWKNGLESDLLGSLIGAMAYALSPAATCGGVFETALELCRGTLSKALLSRAIEVGESSGSQPELCENVYRRMLIHREPPRDVNGVLQPELPGTEDTDESYSSIYFVEQIPLMFAGLAFGRGDIGSIAATVMLGRDCDSTATAVGFLVGALHGLSALPREWVEMVEGSNLSELDLMAMGRDLYQLSAIR